LGTCEGGCKGGRDGQQGTFHIFFSVMVYPCHQKTIQASLMLKLEYVVQLEMGLIAGFLFLLFGLGRSNRILREKSNKTCN
jgi:hypothetical protein